MSNINPSLIDATFPIAGQDNDSQGFRTNSANIVTNFTYAANELTDLQNKVVLKSALTGGSLNNNFAGALMFNANTKGFGQVILDNGTITGALAINFSNGSFQRVTTSGAMSISFNTWPTSGNLGIMRLEVIVTNTAHTLTLPSAVSLGTTGILGLSGLVITFPTTGVFLYEFSSFDSGASIFIRDMLNNKTSSAGSINAIAASSINLNVTAIGSQAAAAAGTIFRVVNVDTAASRIGIDSYVNAGNPASGMTLRGARGTAATPTAIQNTDMFGTLSAHGYGATSFQATSTGLISFIAEGNFTDASQPTAVSFQVTPASSITKSEQMRLSSAGVLTLNANVPSSGSTTGTLIVTGGVGISNNLFVAGAITGVLNSTSVTVTGGTINGTTIGATTPAAIVSTAMSTAIINKTTTYNVGAADGTITCNATGGAFTVTLPAASTNTGRIIRIIKIDSVGANAITIASAGGSIFNSGGGGTSIATQYARFTYQSDGTNWYVIGN